MATVATYSALGMEPLDAVVNGAATIATGGFSSSDASFSKYPGAPEYAGILFMLLGSLPYIRFVQLLRGEPRPILADPQVRAILCICFSFTVGVTMWRVATTEDAFEPVLRETLFNLTSILTGTGFSSGSYSSWDGLALVAGFVAGMIGGCSGSSSGALSIFRIQIVYRAVLAELQRIRHPFRISPLHYEGRPVGKDVIDAVILFSTSYVLLLGILSVGVSLTGVDLLSSVLAVWTSIGNIGYGYGPLVAQTGTFREYPDLAKVMLMAAMVLGRLGLLTMLVLVLPGFWRD